jgi:Pyruvate/2-oxoacid:ferredoxin oxidoreductase delta subunit
LALGQETDGTLLRGIAGIESDPDGTVHVGANMMTGYPGIFAGGDMVPGERTVAVAVGHGKRAARHIDAWLRGDSYRGLEPQQRPESRLVSFDMLHLPIYADTMPARQPELPADRRTAGFDEVVAGLTEAEARREAQRCFSCGTCFECDNCYAACPEDAIVKLGPGQFYRVEYGKCTGCALCFEECPCHAIEMMKVEA